MRVVRSDPVRPGEESVRDRLRPAVGEPTAPPVLVELGGMVLVDARRAVRTPEASRQPSYCVPPGDIAPGVLVPAAGSGFRERKGVARRFDVPAVAERRERAAWSCPDPTPSFASLRDHVAFCAVAIDGRFVDGERVVPRPGGFHGGWIASAVAGQLDGVPGSRLR